MALAEATDSLLAFATTLESSSLRHVAVESLGERREPRVISFLNRLARGGGDSNVRTGAVEALGNMNEDGFAAIAELARDRSEERRVGKEWRSRWWADHRKKKRR